MRDASPARLSIGIASDGLALVLAHGWLRRRVVDQRLTTWHAGDHPSPAQVGGHLASLLAGMQCRGAGAHVVVADEHVRHWMVTPPVNARVPADCRAAAALRFQMLYGESSDAWRWDADWAADRPFLASGLPLPWLDMLQQVGAEHGLRLLTVQPELVAVWNRWRPALAPQAWFGAASGRRMTLAAMVGGDLHAITRLVLPAAEALGGIGAAAWLQQAVQREALRWMLDAPQRLQWCGAAADDWPNALAAHPAAAPPPGWSCSPCPPGRAVAGRLAAAQPGQRPALALAMAGW